MRRSKRIQVQDNHERWLISYADFITLLFAFFVVMYSLSSPDNGKYRLFTASLSESFKSLGQQETVPPANENEELLKTLVAKRDSKLLEQIRNQKEAMQAIVSDVNRAISPLLKSGQVMVTQSEHGIKIDINASALFNQGDARLLGDASETLTEVAKVLKNGSQAIEVEGHTDDVPIKTPQFPSNWELSSARASSVVRLFIDNGVDAKRLSAVGYADNHPLQPNDTPEGRALNRRVTVIILAPVIGQP
jgi:chemotaxis protein MotB